LSIEWTPSPSIDLDAAARELASERRLQVQDFLTDDSAHSLHAAIASHSPWFVSFNEGPENYEVLQADLDRIPASQRARFLQQVEERAGRQYQYLFLQYYVTEMIRRGEGGEYPLNALQTLMNTPETLEIFRRLSGEPDVREVDVMVSRYDRGHFLMQHDDSHASRDRVAAYVLNLTPEWRADWGGHLAFFDEIGNIEKALVPRFNTLNMFLVPQHHSVQMVAPFAPKSRMSITGWLHR
jgi:Rps23 Pro-64 3,4-dihydroxylase Tpa1-like proline 4-hydroxylase